MQEMHVLGKGTCRETSRNVTNCDNEVLKMKLLEALGFVPQMKTTADLPKYENPKKLNVKHRKRNQNSSPTGTGSDSPDQAKCGLVTRSSAREKSPTKTATKMQHQVSRKRPPPSSISDHKPKFQENIFSFDLQGGKEENQKWPLSGYPSKSKSKSSGQRVAIEPRKIYFPRQSASGMNFPDNTKEKLLPSSRKPSSESKGTSDFLRPSSKAKTSSLKLSSAFPRESSVPIDDNGETNESQDLESPLNEKEAEEQFPQYPTSNQDFKSFVEDGFKPKVKRPKKMFPNAGDVKKSSFTLRRGRWVNIQEDGKTKRNLSQSSPMDTSRTEETIGSHEASKPQLSRTFSQMTSVLEGFNTKLKSHTSKKNSEILSSALNKIRLQLQAVESQIQTDVRKLTNVGKSKRRGLESTFQEKNERLRVLHDKFKEEVNQQLSDCRNTLEELEAYQVELKGSAERHKASQKKLLMQAEETVKAQLTEADTCVTAVNKEARKRMNGLKQVLEEWMKEGEETL